MNNEDKKLGMNKDISRRDFINGVGIALGSSAFGSTAFSKTNSAQDEFGYYPPKLMGMRGSHPGSFEVAHLIRDGAKFETADIDEEYDLVVVGAGISGLSAAYFYKNNVNKDAKILIIHKKIAKITHDCLKGDQSFLRKHLIKKITLISDSQMSAGVLSIR